MTIYEAIKDVSNINNELQKLYEVSDYRNIVGAIRIGLGLKHDDSLSHISPKQVANICERAGATTLEELISVDILKLTERVPNVNIHTLADISMKDLHKAVVTTKGFKTINNEDFKTTHRFTDGTYKLLTKEALDEILLYIPKVSSQYISVLRDCDDFQREVRGWLSSVGLGNITIGWIDTQAGQSGHAGLLAVYRKGDDIEVKFLEPQNGSLYNIGSPLTVANLFNRDEILTTRWGF